MCAFAPEAGASLLFYGQVRPPDSARRVFLERCNATQTLPLPLLIARDPAANREIDLSHYKMGDQLAQNFALVLPKMAAQGVEVEALLLSHNPIGEPGILAIAGALESCQQLRRLCGTWSLR